MEAGLFVSINCIGAGQTSYKQYLLEKCSSRDDVLAEEVGLRIAAWLVRYLTYMRPKLDTTGIAYMCRFFANRLLSTDNEGGPLSPRSQYQPDMA